MSSPNMNGQTRLFPRTPIMCAVRVDDDDTPAVVDIYAVHFHGPMHTIAIHLTGDRLTDGDLLAIGQAVWAALS